MTKITLKRHALSFIFSVIMTSLCVFLFLINGFSLQQGYESIRDIVIAIFVPFLLSIFLMYAIYRLGNVKSSHGTTVIHIVSNTLFTIILVNALIKTLGALALLLSTRNTAYLIYAIFTYIGFSVFFLWYLCFLLVLNSNRHQLWSLIKTALYFLMGGFTIILLLEFCILFFS